jgi:hypothetical protein
MDFSAESTSACATDDLPTPDAPMSIGQRPGLIRQRVEHRGGFDRTAIEIVGVGLVHRLKAMVGIDQLPERRRASHALALERGEEPMQHLVLGNDRGLDPIEVAQEGRPGAAAPATIAGTTTKLVSFTWRSNALKYSTSW